MRVVVASEHKMCELTPYTKESIGEALDIFFTPGTPIYCDPDGEAPLTRNEAVETFQEDHRVTFYDNEGDRTVISRDLSA